MVRWRDHGRAWRLVWGRLAVALLSVVVALGAALPAYARLVAGPKAHVCHCETGAGHAHCACPLCFPELEADPGSPFETVKGKCGDDDPGWITLSLPAVPPAAVGVPAPHVVDAAGFTLVEGCRDRRDPPEPRPPRARS